MKFLSLKGQMIIFLAALAVYLSAAGKDTSFLLFVLVAVIAALAADSLFIYFREKRFVLTESSAISGLIIAYVVSGIYPWQVFAAAGLFAMASKHFLRIHGKHLFNPAAFGIFTATVFWGGSLQWRGADAWYILVPAGIYFVWRIRKTGIVFGYFAAYLALFGVQALLQKTPLWDIIQYQNAFFIFVMLIEPKTTPVTTKGKVVFGMAVALLVFVLTQNRTPFDAQILALLGMNIFSPLLNRFR